MFLVGQANLFYFWKGNCLAKRTIFVFSVPYLKLGGEKGTTLTIVGQNESNDTTSRVRRGKLRKMYVVRKIRIPMYRDLGVATLDSY